MYIRTILYLATLFFLLTGCSTNVVWWASKKTEAIAARSEIYSAAAEPNNIALMLPLKGELAASSQAIRNGFLAAYYHARKEHPGVKIKIIDTTDNDVRELYQQAVQDGAEVVVGPLTKKEVEAMVKIAPLRVPTLALNTLDNYVHNFGTNLYQFGLLPQDEAAQVAERMVEEHHERVIIIAPENSWGNKIVNIFKNRYESSGGRVVATLNYRPTSTLAEQVCPFLAADATQLCVPKKQKDKKSAALEGKPTRRQDVDAIFLVATAATARQIVPLLKFYYAGDLPTYSISSIYTGSPAANLDQDLDGVRFCDMPWVINSPETFDGDLRAIYEQIMALWSEAYVGYSRFYALGIDAYNLASRLNGFLNAPRMGAWGASGKLYLDDYNHIYRGLQWAEMHSGLAVLQ